MASVTGRRLEVLALLQSHPGISAADLAVRLDVGERTARRDVAHLRDLGYRIDAEPGRHGGYTLASGTNMPALALDPDEALAVALGLRSATGVAGLDVAAATALAKLTESVPSRQRARFDALALTDPAEGEGRRAADPGTLVTLALACRAETAVRFRHGRGPGATDRPRDAQPHRLVSVAGRWYLVACEPGAGEWKTYALDRIRDVRAVGPRLPTPPPPEDASAFVTEALAHGPWRHHVRVRMFTSGDLARQLVAPWVGDVHDDGDECIVTLGTDDLDWAARFLVSRNVDFDVLEPPELTERLQALGRWLTVRYPEPVPNGPRT
ncbi:MAG: helix-turn-helix transcriptional regulator [Iamia sp.]